MYSNCLHQRLHVLYSPSDHSEKDKVLESSKRRIVINLSIGRRVVLVLFFLFYFKRYD